MKRHCYPNVGWYGLDRSSIELIINFSNPRELVDGYQFGVTFIKYAFFTKEHSRILVHYNKWHSHRFLTSPHS